MSRRLRFFDENSEPLEQRIATALHKVGLVMKQQAWLQASEAGLSPTQGQILAALELDGPLTASELAERLGVTLPTISDSVRALVEKDLLRKRPDPRHPRASLLELTPAGKKHAARASAWPEYLISAVSAMSEDEQRVFMSGLVKMIRALQDAGKIPINRMCISCVHFRPRVHDGPRPHHCAFVDAPMAAEHVRVDCADHEEAPGEQRAAAWERFTMPR
jgi:DNA-binding MarR family transcriptional regulator